jgi:hypothetical protein
MQSRLGERPRAVCTLSDTRRALPKTTYIPALALIGDSPVTGIDGPLGQVVDLLFDVRWAVRGLWISVPQQAGQYTYLVPTERLVHSWPAQRTFRASLWREDVRRRAAPGGVPPPASGCSGEQLVGCRLHAADGACGRIVDLAIDERWSLVALLVEAESWLRSPPTVVPPRDIEYIDLMARAVYTARTRRELARAPLEANAAK